LISAATWLLKRQVAEVTRAESQWRTEAAWRRAMEDSLTVALRARDTEGRLVYVNRAFCDLVGLPAETLLGRLPPMPYWPPDAMAHQARLTMLGEIASTLAHELNQPLTAIASYNAGVVNSLKRAGVDHAVVYGALQRLGEQAAQAGAVVQRIREFLTRRGPQR